MYIFSRFAAIVETIPERTQNRSKTRFPKVVKTVTFQGQLSIWSPNDSKIEILEIVGLIVMLKLQ